MTGHRARERTASDYALITHFHPTTWAHRRHRTHVTLRRYRLRGITEVAEEIPIAPNRSQLARLEFAAAADALFQNYRRFVDTTCGGKLAVIGARAAAPAQLVPIRRPAAVRDFEAHRRGERSRVDEKGDTTRRASPLDTIAVPEDRPTRTCSVALHIR
jgi:hypothetical protein